MASCCMCLRNSWAAWSVGNMRRWAVLHICGAGASGEGSQLWVEGGRSGQAWWPQGWSAQPVALQTLGAVGHTRGTRSRTWQDAVPITRGASDFARVVFILERRRRRATAESWTNSILREKGPESRHHPEFTSGSFSGIPGQATGSGSCTKTIATQYIDSAWQ